MSRTNLSTLIFLLCVSIQDGGGARILAYIPSCAYSHQTFYQPLWHELAHRGHNIVVLTTEPTKEDLPNFREISLRASCQAYQNFINALIEHGPYDSKVVDVYEEFVQTQIGIPAFQDFLRNPQEHFDLLMIEHLQGPFFALKKRFNCPMMGVLSMDAFPTSHESMANPTHPLLYPHIFIPIYGDLSFYGRILIMGYHLQERMFSRRLVSRLNRLATKYLGMTVDVGQIMGDETDMVLINANPVFTQVRPLTPNTINLGGGIQIKPPQPLPEDLKTFLDTSLNVIYLSFGTNVKSNQLSLQKRDIIIKTLKSLPYKVLWKFEDDSLPGKPENVMITKWVPQQDVLRHPNVKLFITQGGMQSLEEALHSHVPMIVVPFLADQIANSLRVKAKGLGLTLSHRNLTVDGFRDVILQVLKDPKYKDNLRILAARSKDQPMSPLETAVWWTEYVLRHKGAQHLKGPKIPTYQYYYLDVLGFLGLVFGIFMGISILMLKLIIKKIRSLICSTPKSIPKKSKVKRA